MCVNKFISLYPKSFARTLSFYVQSMPPNQAAYKKNPSVSIYMRALMASSIFISVLPISVREHRQVASRDPQSVSATSFGELEHRYSMPRRGAASPCVESQGFRAVFHLISEWLRHRRNLETLRSVPATPFLGLAPEAEWSAP
jgi:hypothetical protein